MSAILAAAEIGYGLYQDNKANQEKKDAENGFNKYEIPSGINAMMDVMRTMSTQTEMPGSDILRARQASSTAQGVETAGRTQESSGDVLGLLGSVYSKQLDSAEKMTIANAQNYQQNRMRYANALQTLGGYQTEKWKYNELYPYIQGMTAAGQTNAAGNANISSGIGSMIDVYGAKQNMDWMDNNQQSWLDTTLGKYSGQPQNANQPVNSAFGDTRFEQRDFFNTPTNQSDNRFTD
jgi:hypothetical protein